MTMSRSQPNAAEARSPESVRAPEVLTRALHRATKNLGMAQGDVAKTIGVSDASVSRLFAEQRTIDPKTKEGELTILFLRLYRSLDALVGSEEAARKWFHAPNHHLRGTPAELVKTVEGLVDVIQYLDAMRGKT
jgi:uncharacterized protein (DUF2384 family)